LNPVHNYLNLQSGDGHGSSHLVNVEAMAKLNSGIIWTLSWSSGLRVAITEYVIFSKLYRNSENPTS
jgi:hypothetical protein